MKAALFALFLLAGPSSDEKKSVDVTCPLDGTIFKVVRIIQTNQWGGVDKDFCPHAFKTRPLEYWVWVCPACNFAGLKKDFEAGLTAEEKGALLGKLRPAQRIGRRAKQADIPGHVKYDLLAQVRQLRNRSDDAVGQAYLYASWSCRQRGAVYLHYFEEWEKVREKYGFNRTPLELGVDRKTKKIKNRTDYEFEAVKRLEKDISGKKMFTRGVNRRLAGQLGRYLAAYVYRRHGENAEAERWIRELEPYKGENSVVDDAVDTMVESLSCERTYQRKALERYTRAAENESLSRVARGEISYLVAEIYRRLGEPKAASDWYEKALALNPSAAIRALVEQQQPKVHVTPTKE